jgi:hypothetical protein
LSQIAKTEFENYSGKGLQRWRIFQEETPKLKKTARAIHGVRLHLLPERSKGGKALYKDIRFEKWKE